MSSGSHLRRSFKNLLAIIGVGLSGLFLWLAVRDAEPAALWRALRSANPLWLGPFLLSLAVFCWLKAVRWRMLLAPAAQIRARDLVAPVIIGYMGTGLLPIQLGEVVRAYAAAYRLGARMATMLASLLVERILDVFMLFSILSLVGLLGPGFGVEFRSIGLLFAVAAACACLALWVYATHTEGFIAVTGRCTSFLPGSLRTRVLEHLRVGAAGAQALRDPGRYTMLAVLSLLQWCCMWACTWISLAAVGMFVSPLAALTVLATTMVSMTLPAGPGYIGTLQLAYVLALAPFGIDRDTAFAASVVYLAALWVPLVVGGLALLHRSGMRLTTIAEQSGSAKAEPSTDHSAS